MGGLAYMTPLRITWGDHSAIAYKRDFGFGGGPIDGLPRVIDLWWQFAEALGIPYEHGLWSGPVRVSARRRPAPATCSARRRSRPRADAAAAATRPRAPGWRGDGVPLDPGRRGRSCSPDGQAAAPADAPAAVKGIIAAGNQIVGKPYVVRRRPRAGARPGRAGL